MSPQKTLYWKAAAILLIGWVLRLAKLGDASLWVDEVITDTWMNLSLGEMFSLLLDDVVHMPMYFLFVRLFPTQTELLLRFPSVLIGLLSIALMMAVVLRLYRSRSAALWSGLLLACNPLHVWLSRMARPYSLLFLVSLLVSAYFWMLLRGKRTRRMWLLFTLSSAAAYFTHFFALLLPLVQILFVIPSKRRFSFNWLFAQFIACLPALIVLPNLFFAVFLGSGTSGFEEHVSWIRPPDLLDPLLTMTNMAVGYDGRPMNPLILPGLLAAAVGVLLGAYQRKNRYWIVMILAPLLIIFVLSLFRSLYMDRYFVIFLPAVLLLMWSGWQRLHHPAWLAAIVILTGLWLVVTDLQNGTFHRYDWSHATAFIEERYQPGDAIILNGDPSFMRYFDPNDLAAAVLFDTNTTHKNVEVHPFSELSGYSGTRIWVVYGNPGPNRNAHSQGTYRSDPFDREGYWMIDWLKAHQEQIVSQRSFNGISVFLVDLNTP